jgi:hypothetical protein
LTKEEVAMPRGSRLFLSFVFFALALALPALAQEEGAAPEEKKAMPVEEMVKIIESQPALANNSFYYDNGFKAVGSFAVHDHFAKRICMGYIVSDGKRLAYRYIRAMPGLGSSNDAFETELSNVARAEYKFYAASRGFMDSYPERLSVKFIFKQPITGLMAKWTKKDFKVDIWDVQFGNKLMSFLKEAGVESVVRD